MLGSKSIRRILALQRQGQYKVLPHFPIPSHINKPFYYNTKGKAEYCSTFKGTPEIHNAETIKKMRVASQIAAGALQAAINFAKEGVTTEEIDEVVHNYIISKNAYPSGVYFMGFPKSVCTSVNEVVCHGIPNTRPLQDGDIVNFDVTAYFDGVYGDTSDMVMIGSSHNDKIKLLVDCTRKSVWKAIDICRPGNKINRIGEVIEEYVQSFGFGVCKEFLGHGIGTHMHMPPPIMNSKNDVDEIMKPGMTFTIEPIVMENPKYRLGIWEDGWTVVDMTGALSAQYEHIILITESDPEVLTDRSKLFE
jgi:methionyl aminopeptidase